MPNILIEHWPILQVIAYLICGLVCAILNAKYARYLTFFVMIGVFLFSACYLQFVGSNASCGVSYLIGNWGRNIGVEYKLNLLNQYLIVYFNLVSILVVISCHAVFLISVIQNIAIEYHKLFYSIIMFIQAGYIGVLSTNDIFNLYVFLEIASLGSYILIAQGKDSKCIVGAFDYLILGTISTTLILIGIGFIFATTGTLNISEIQLYITQFSHVLMYKSFYSGLAFVLIGCLLKLAFFPMHFWMLRAYSFTSSITLAYLSGITGIVGVYIMLKFLHCMLSHTNIPVLMFILKPIALFGIIFGSIYALNAKNIRHILIYSSSVQMGYILLLVAINSPYFLMINFLLSESINKIAIFIVITLCEEALLFRSNNMEGTRTEVREHTRNPKFDNANIEVSKVYIGKFTYAVCIVNIIFAAGLPIGNLFMMKIKLIEVLFSQYFYMSIVIVLFASLMSLLYYYKIYLWIKRIYSSLLLQSQNDAKTTLSYVDTIGIKIALFIITIAQFMFIPIMSNYKLDALC